MSEIVLEKYHNMFLDKGIDLILPIAADSVVTAAWTLYKCKYGCKMYGKNHCCPPAAPTYKETQEILDSYSKGLLFRTHEISLVTPLAVELAKELFLDGYYKAIGFGAGSCQKCEKCNPAQCNFPGQTVPSMEACGIDVFATVRSNGLEIQTLREKGEEQNHFGLILYE